MEFFGILITDDSFPVEVIFLYKNYEQEFGALSNDGKWLRNGPVAEPLLQNDQGYGKFILENPFVWLETWYVFPFSAKSADFSKETHPCDSISKQIPWTLIHFHACLLASYKHKLNGLIPEWILLMLKFKKYFKWANVWVLQN